MSSVAAVGAKAHRVLFLKADIHALQRVSEFLVGDDQCPRQLFDVCNLIFFEHPVITIGKWMNLESTAKIFLDDKRVDQVEVQIFQSLCFLEGHDKGYLSDLSRIVH